MSQEPPKKPSVPYESSASTPEAQLKALADRLKEASLAYAYASLEERDTAWAAREAAWEDYRKASPEERAWDAFVGGRDIYISPIQDPPGQPLRFVTDEDGVFHQVRPKPCPVSRWPWCPTAPRKSS